MNVSGHEAITKRAVREFLNEVDEAKRGRIIAHLFHRRDTHVRGEHVVGPADVVSERDLRDVLSLGHWFGFGQAHHFMRRFGEQSPYDAYRESREHIYHNARAFSEAVGKSTYASNASLQRLGDALHALEDSFAPAHVLRERQSGHGAGPIAHIKRYAGIEKLGHVDLDKDWLTASGSLSAGGSLAKDAAKDLLHVIFGTGGWGKPMSGWLRFVDKWLRVSRKLSRKRDESADVVERFSHDRRVNAPALAEELIRIGSDFGRVRDVMLRLRAASADNVALAYFQRLTRPGSSRVLEKFKAEQVATQSGARMGLADVLIQALQGDLPTPQQRAAVAALRKMQQEVRAQ